MNIVKRLRVESDLSQGDFGALFDVSASHISRLESGLKEPSIFFVNRLSEYFHIKQDQIWAGLREKETGYDNSARYKELYEASLSELQKLRQELAELKLAAHLVGANTEREYHS